MRKINIYTVEDEPIGKGGMGVVYLGHDDLGNKIALKAMHPQLMTDTEIKNRFLQEIDILSQLDHPNIVKLMGAFTANGTIYMAMEYCEGVTLEKYVRQNGPLPEKVAVDFLTQILPALQMAHDKGFVHRDIKPNNIMVHNHRVKLLDFGIAKNNNNRLTQGSYVLGSNGYMSPEQAEGYDIDLRSDIYSLGLVLWYMLVGRSAIAQQKSSHATIMAVIDAKIPRAKDLVPSISDHVQSILDKALEKNMLKRFRSCNEMLHALGAGGNSSQPVAPLYQKHSKPDKGSSVRKKITVGREGCDINLSDPQCRISRHHATIYRDPTQEGNDSRVTYLFEDCSSNGTTINGQSVHHAFYQIEDGETPVILLANRYPLDWDYVVNMLSQGESYHEVDSLSEDSSGDTQDTAQKTQGKDATNAATTQSQHDSESTDDGAPWDAVTVIECIFGFGFPILALIFWLIHRKSNPVRAHRVSVAGGGGVFVGMIIRIIGLVVNA